MPAKNTSYQDQGNGTWNVTISGNVVAKLSTAMKDAFDAILTALWGT